LIQSGSILSCLAAENVFYYLKGRGPVKISKKNCRNVEEYKAYRLIPLTPPLLFHFTVPLTHFEELHLKKRFSMFPSPAGMSPNSPWARIF
jgi:hypothetical protein